MTSIQTALAALVPEADGLLDWVASMGGDARTEGVLPGHITLVFPFIPMELVSEAELTRLREFFAAQPAFGGELVVGWFGREVLLLVPADPAPLIRLTQAVVDAWPEYPYYGGAYSEVEPHATLAYGDEASLCPMAERVEAMGAIPFSVSSIALCEGSEMQVRYTFGLSADVSVSA